MRAPKLWLACGLAVAALVPWLALPDAGIEAECRALDRDRAELDRVREAKGAILADLRAGRVTLAAATDAYYEMVVVCQRLLDGLRFAEPHADSDLERAAARLADHALHEAPAADRPALAARLDAERRERFPRRAVTPPPGATAGPAPSPPSPRPAG